MQSIFLFITFAYAVATAASLLDNDLLITKLLKNTQLSTRKSSKAQNDDITYYYFTRTNTNGESFKSKDISSIPSNFDATKDTLFIIHGWLDKYNSLSVKLLTTAALKTYDINVIAVDWSPVADDVNYLGAKDGVPNIGKFLGNFLQNLTSTYDIPLSKISIVGHSLGAHIAGVAGKVLNGELDLIIGLDPAAPFIDSSDKDYTLDSSDAKFVQVIHTSGGKLGLRKSLGHADYYPNGGSEQPGCTLDLFGDCAHQRSFKYFAESITDNKFYSKACSNYDEFKAGTCSGAISLMGGYNVDKTASGKYYLTTNSDSPYGEGEIV